MMFGPPPFASARFGRVCIAVAALLSLSLSLSVAGCGFRPIYAHSTGASQKLAAMDVVTGSGRTNYLLRQAVIDGFAAYGDAEPLYTLTLEVDERRAGFGITAQDVATRYEVVLNVRYALVRSRDGKLVDRGRVSGAASYDVPRDSAFGEDPYASIAVEENAKVRAADLAAERLRAVITIAVANEPLG